MSKAQKALPLPEIYYQDHAKDYYVENDQGMWIRINEGSVKRHLKVQGYPHGYSVVPCTMFLSWSRVETATTAFYRANESRRWYEA
jgi:hypothetical protein